MDKVEVTGLGVTTCLLILKVLNTLPADDVHTRFVDGLDLDAMPAWQKIRDFLR